MPHGDPDPTDPMTLHGVVVETEDDRAMREMAECFIEEYIRSGFGPERILKMFGTREYAGPHLAYRLLGAEAIGAMVDRHAALRAHRKSVPAVRSGNGDICLPVLE